MTPVIACAGVALIALVLYAILGGADFGGGVWDLLATGPRAERQRETISDAIGPVWEANHVWLIFAIVTLFTCFPLAYADVGVGLYAPLSFALVGIVLRGAAFVFRNHAEGSAPTKATWTAVFGAASLIAPFFLGDAVGALATGRYAWTSPFALAVGLFALTVCAQIAAVFLLHETADPELRADFRRRAIRATVAVWIVGLLPAALAAQAAPQLLAALGRPTVAGAVAAALVAGIVVIVTVAGQHDRAARVAVGAEAVAILSGWFGAQAPDLVPGHLTYLAAAAADSTLDAFLVAAGIGALFLIPSLALLLRVFKRRSQDVQLGS
jgi:cytochrome bd ubiquinol oxidase subunit II